MEPFYLEIRAIHIGAVAFSGLLMLLRGIAHNWLGAPWMTGIFSGEFGAFGP